LVITTRRNSTAASRETTISARVSMLSTWRLNAARPPSNWNSDLSARRGAGRGVVDQTTVLASSRR